VLKLFRLNKLPLYTIQGGSGAKDLDKEWEAQQELLKLRKASPEEREKYFDSVSINFLFTEAELFSRLNR
jgi:hypothetical protein